MKNIKKLLMGFTIIELMVVVVIISVLASIVLSSIVIYLNKGKNASIKENLANLLVNGSVYIDINGSYADFCNSSYFINSRSSMINAGGNPNCSINGSSSAWCSCSTLQFTAAEPFNSTICVDSTGYKKVTQNSGLCAIRCPHGFCLD